MTKLVRMNGAYGRGAGGQIAEGWMHYCPACKCSHGFAVEVPFYNGAKWTFDGNFEKPTFNPSMNIAWGPMPEGHPNAGKIERCHYFLHGGMIQYLPDCTHDLRGQTVPLPDIPGGKAI